MTLSFYWWESFEGDSVGDSPPAGWHNPWNADTLLSIEESTGFYEKSMAIAASASEEAAYHDDVSDVDSDGTHQTLALIRSPSAESGADPVFGVSMFGGATVGATGRVSAYATAGLTNRAWQIVQRDANGDDVVIDEVSSLSNEWDFDTWYWLRMEFEPDPSGPGTARARYWEDGTAEPSTWNMEGTLDNDPPSGWIGFLTGADDTSSAENRQFDVLAVGTHGTQPRTDDQIDYPEPQPIPDGLQVRNVKVVTPTLDAAEERVDTIARADWGRLMIVIDGVDRTWLDDVPATPEQWSNGQPFGDGPAILRFPSRGRTDSELVGWVDDDAAILLVRPDGTKKVLWEGYIVSPEDAEDGTATDLHCVGALYQLDEYVRAPLLVDFDVDIVEFIDAQFSQTTRPHLRFNFPDDRDPHAYLHVEGTPPTRFTRKTGAWDNPLTGYIRDILFHLHETDGTQWTMDLLRNRTPRLRAVKAIDPAEVDATLDTRLPGVEPELSFDASETVNVVYGEGTDRAGQVWRNADYSRGIAVYEPLAHTDAAHPSDNPGYDPTIIRRERHVQFGGGIGHTVGVESAEQILERDGSPRWVGRITLTVDPAEMSRFEIVQGMNLQLDNYRGQTLIVQVVEQQVDWRGLSVTLTVDEQARDLLTVAEIIERRRASNTGPVAQLRRGRSSEIVEDTKVPWDGNAGSGYLPRPSVNTDEPATDPPSSNADAFIELSNGAWIVTRIFAAQKATIMATRMQLYDSNGAEISAPFYVAFFDGEVAPADLDSPPIQVGDEWSSLPEGVAEVVGWGVEGQRAGYSPGLESEGDSQTGALEDDENWQIDLSPGQGSLWLAVWLDGGPATAYLQGRLFQGVE